MRHDHEPAADNLIALDERQWLPRHCRGDVDAFDELIDAYQQGVYSYMVRCGVSHADRDDLFQVAFMKVHINAANYEPTRELRPWLFTVVANTVRNHFRDEHKHNYQHTDIDVEELRCEATVETTVRDQQLLSQVEHLIAQLPLAQREVLILAAVEGFQQSEVSRILDMPLNTVKTNLRRARMTLASQIAGTETNP